MIIAVDHGNRQIKSPNTMFVSGYAWSESQPPPGSDALKYNGRYYTLSEQRFPFQRDKTTDEWFFVLTLFAIAQEIEAAKAYPQHGVEASGSA